MINQEIITSILKKILLSLVVLFAGNLSYGQVYGCNDPLANNYNPLASINNGSCTYDVKSYAPPVKVNPLNLILPESSGLQMAGNFLWSFNDGGGAAAIYRIDTLTNTVLQTVYLGGATNVDWEDIAFDGTNFYVGDFGNNLNGGRTDLKIYKFPFCAIPDYAGNGTVTIPAAQVTIINFKYSNQLIPQQTGNNKTKFDCEAMIIDAGKIHLFSKNWIDLTSTHYEINGLIAGNYIADSLETLATNYLVTGADKANGQKLVALLGYFNAFPGNHFMHLLTNYSGGNYFNGNKRKINLPDGSTMGQAEGICFRTETYGYISNEKVTAFGITVNQKLFSFDISGLVSTLARNYIFTGNGNWSDPANWMNNIVPPAVINAGSEIIIDPAPCGQCLLNIPFTVPSGVKLTLNKAKNFVIQQNLNVQ